MCTYIPLRSMYTKCLEKYYVFNDSLTVLYNETSGSSMQTELLLGKVFNCWVHSNCMYLEI